MVETQERELTKHFRNSVIHIEPTPRWVRCVFAGVTVADSKDALLLRSQGARRGLPLYYFPIDDVRMDLMEPSGRADNDPYIGDATFYNLVVNGRTATDAAWSFGEPTENAPDLRGYVAFEWDKVDPWFEEADEVFKHARDPYKRIDCIPSSRHVQVVLGGVTVAETERPILLFETGLPTRYYIPKADVRMDVLQDSDKVTRCPYKGLAYYYSVDAGGELHDDIAWFYPHTTAEAMRIGGGYIAFFDERVDAVYVDGIEDVKPQTQWSR